MINLVMKGGKKYNWILLDYELLLIDDGFNVIYF